jgi:hypothetical protein
MKRPPIGHYSYPTDLGTPLFGLVVPAWGSGTGKKCQATS